VIFTILGFVVALLIHFVVLSSIRYNWFDNLTPQGLPGAALVYTVYALRSFLGI
jgi:hypothetical protein